MDTPTVHVEPEYRMLASRLGASYPADHVQASTLAIWSGALARLPFDHAETVVTKAVDAYPNRAPSLGLLDVLIDEERAFIREEQASLPDATPLTTRDRLAMGAAARAAIAEYHRFIRAGGGPPRPLEEVRSFVVECVDGVLAEFDSGNGRMTEAEADRLVDDAIYAFGRGSM